jgi:membrane protein implicated in regulation of membrane protease activity
VLQRHPFLAFLWLRTALLVGVAAIFMLLGLRGIPAVLLALVVSSVVSLFVLNRQRDAVSTAIDRRFTGLRKRINEAAASEDE